ncbi:MAG TPA: hypothetical protein VMA95_01720, partial [Streptosporangiaceae bacterium]|nr:hypothetical protein [Streptosporangiaceae bacterium]
AGTYDTNEHGMQPFIVGQVHGTWGKAVQVPGTATLGSGQHAQVTSVSCPSAGNCGAAGDYTDDSGHEQAFVVSQVKGTWGKAIQVPGTAATSGRGAGASVVSLSCASAGNCGAAGDYADNDKVFVVSQVKGTWGTAIGVPGPGQRGAGRFAQVNSVSCASAGNCAAGGTYDTNGHGMQPFIVGQVKGTWGKAIQVPGLAVNTDADATVTSVSCPSAGNCSAGGYYDGGNYSGGYYGGGQPFVVSEVKGTWGKAIKVPGTIAYAATVTSVSCSSAGNCAAAGYYGNGEGTDRAFVASQVKGTWGKAIQVPGTTSG